jgi:hypothetical protein
LGKGFLGLPSSPMMMEIGQQMKERSAIRRLRDGGEGGFEASPNAVDRLLGRRAWSKRGERIGEAGHEESKPAK